MTDLEPVDVWYLANGEKGFTADPAKAVKDQTGAPVICGGLTLRLQRRHNRQQNVQRKAVDEIWTLLMDKVEEGLDLSSNDFHGMIRNEAEQHVLCIVLSVLELGADYHRDPVATLATIKGRAAIRYLKESEDA